MLIPQFSIRTLFIVIAFCTMNSWIFSLAYRGRAWAIGATGAIVALAMSFLFFAGVWLVAMAIASVARVFQTKRPVAESPFAMQKEAPQVLEPREYEV